MTALPRRPVRRGGHLAARAAAVQAAPAAGLVGADRRMRSGSPRRSSPASTSRARAARSWPWRRSSPSSTPCCRRCWPPYACRSWSRSASCSSCSLDALALKLASDVLDEHLHGRQLRLGAPRRARRRRRQRRARGDLRDERRRHLHASGSSSGSRAARAARREPTCRGSSSSRSTASRCRCCAGRCATATRRTWRAGSPRARTRSPSGSPTSRRRPGPARPGSCSGSNDDIPAFRWVDKETGLLTACSAPDDCARIERERATGHRPARRRRHEPRQPALGRGRRGHPHGQPDRGREAGQPGLPRLLRERLQRHARARPLLLGAAARVDGGAARDPARRAPARPPRRAPTRSCARRCA